MTLLVRRVLPSQLPQVRADLDALQAGIAKGPLGVGDSGEAVAALQRHLRAAGLLSGAVSGTYDSVTQAAVAQLQSKKGLPATGEVDRATLQAVKAINKRVEPGFKTKAQRGERGRDILAAERALAKLGFLAPEEADGIYDRATQDGVLRLRRADPKLADKGVITEGLYARLRQQARGYDHDAFRRRDIGTKQEVAAHRRLDDRTAKAAARGEGLGVGAEGRAVENAERHLEAAGYDLGKANASFGRRTEAALKAFQRQAGLEETGRLNRATWAKLRGSLFAARSGTSPAQRTGEHSAAVKRSEKMLAELGWKGVKADGVFDRGTERTVRGFQKKRGLEVTGEINDRTFKALRKRYQEKIHKVTKPHTINAPSPNHNSRGGADIDCVVLHHTAGGSTQSALNTLRSPSAGVSAHYLVGKDGKIYHLVDNKLAAWHAGVAALHGDTSPSVNNRSIGIEIVNEGDGKHPFTAAQYKALEQLVPWLMKTYKVPMNNLVGHKDVALPKGRKTDPASNFDWGRIRRAVRQST